MTTSNKTTWDRARSWAASGADLYRGGAADVPPTHLVVYFAPLTPNRQQILLVAHRKAGLWLPPGGHVEPGEEPWATVTREAAEELHLAATPSPITGPAPVFVTVTRTRGHPPTDVTLWFCLDVSPGQITSYDAGEFTGVRWWPLAELRQHLDTPASGYFEPHLARFLNKLTAPPS